jgi:hypothetical protein
MMRAMGKRLVPFAFVRRSAALRRIQVAWAGSFLGDSILAVGLGVLAYRAAGPKGVAVLVAVQMLPAAALAPVVSAATHSASRERLILRVDVVRAAVAVSAAALVAARAPNEVVVVLAAVLMTATAVATPARRALIPLLVTSPAELTAAGIVASVVQAAAVTLGPALAALLFVAGRSWMVIAAASVCYLVAAVADLGLPSTAAVTIRLQSGPLVRGLSAGLAAVRSSTQLKLAAAMFAAKNLARGALNVLVIVIPLQLLGLHASAVGWLTASIGLGGVVGGFVATGLVGRHRMAGPMALGLAAWGAPLLALGLAPGLVVALAGLAVLGGGNTVTDVAGYTLIARSTRDDLLTRVLGVHEGIRALAITAGSAATALLISLESVRVSLSVVGVGLGAVAALAAVARRGEPSPQLSPTDIRLLRANPLFGWLPPVALERVAYTATSLELPAGGVLLQQGDDGDRAYLVTEGELAAAMDGREIGRIGRGGIVGEIALLHAAPRMATVRALQPTRLLAIDRDEFLAAATGGAAAREAADELVSTRLALANDP